MPAVKVLLNRGAVFIEDDCIHFFSGKCDTTKSGIFEILGSNIKPIINSQQMNYIDWFRRGKLE